MKAYLWFFLFFVAVGVQGQDLYKTPSGKRYHKSSCRMVENVSKKLANKSQIARLGLTPCKICRPRSIPLQKGALSPSSNNKAVGTSSSVRCKGKTQKGNRCKHKTRLANGYCYQHHAQSK